MLAGLLYLRFPEEFGFLSAAWAEALCACHPWAADSYVIRAKQAAAAAAQAPETATENAELAVRMLVKAQSRGSPYFTMANQYFNELVESLVAFKALGDEARDNIQRALQRWRRELPLQRCAGTSFSWVSRDQDLLKKDRILAPKRNVSGRLRSSDTAIVFKGMIRGGAIAFETPTATAPKQAGVTRDVCAPPAKISPEPAGETRLAHGMSCACQEAQIIRRSEQWPFWSKGQCWRFHPFGAISGRKFADSCSPVGGRSKSVRQIGGW